jgi:hypothetical protein
MVGDHWFVYPVENGVELVVDSTDAAVYERALATFVTHYLDYNLAAEWSVEGGEVMHYGPAPVDADVPAPAPSPLPQEEPTVVVPVPARARPVGKGRRIPRQSDAA